MSTGLDVWASSLARLCSGRLLLALVACLCVWHGVDALQARLPLSLGWAVLDEIAHASMALVVVLWTWPIWGWRPALVAATAATAIDLDHVIAARSFDTADLMSLSSRPPAHSLLGVVVAVHLGMAFGGPRLGFAAGVGVLMHVVRDATAPPGVPLLFPFGSDWHMQLPALAEVALVVVLASLSVMWSIAAQRSRSADTRSRHRSGYSERELRSRATPAPDSPG